MIVYVLFHETNSGHSEESDGYVEAIYATQELADAAKLDAIRTARDLGMAIYWDPDTEEENEHWDHDWSVQPCEVLDTHTPGKWVWAE
jgi:hypothetical protein